MNLLPQAYFILNQQSLVQGPIRCSHYSMAALGSVTVLFFSIIQQLFAQCCFNPRITFVDQQESGIINRVQPNHFVSTDWGVNFITLSNYWNLLLIVVSLTTTVL